jgi:hypothetical protein
VAVTGAGDLAPELAPAVLHPVEVGGWGA